MQATERALQKLSLMCVLYTLAIVVVVAVRVLNNRNVKCAHCALISGCLSYFFFVFVLLENRACSTACVCVCMCVSVRVFYFIRIFG